MAMAVHRLGASGRSGLLFAGRIVGEVDGGWRVAMGTLAFERGASTLGQQLAFESELQTITELARTNGAAGDAMVRQRLAGAWITLSAMLPDSSTSTMTCQRSLLRRTREKK